MVSKEELWQTSISCEDKDLILLLILSLLKIRDAFLSIKVGETLRKYQDRNNAMRTV